EPAARERRDELRVAVVVVVQHVRQRRRAGVRRAYESVGALIARSECIERRTLNGDAVDLAHLLAGETGGKGRVGGPEPPVVAVDLVELVAAHATTHELPVEVLEHRGAH